jgi:hypothetical protein
MPTTINSSTSVKALLFWNGDTPLIALTIVTLAPR